VVQPAATSSVTDTLFAIGIDSENSFRWLVTGTTLVAQQVLSGVATDLFSAPYDRTTHRFLEIRHDGTNAVFATAAGTSGVPGAWTTRVQTAWNAGIAVTAVRFEVKAGTRDPHPNPGSAVVDNSRQPFPMPRTNHPPSR
jgi:phage baseplate assembly protein gpV